MSKLKDATKFLIFLAILLIGVTAVSGCVQETGRFGVFEEKKEFAVVPGKISNLTKTESVIEMNCSEGVVSYKEQSSWNRELEDGQFKEELIGEFEESMNGFDVEAKDCSVELEENSATLACHVHGSLQRTWYDFDWFLRPRSLDFLDSHFERQETELHWKGLVAGVSTTISINFPWPISNCHEHVWKK